jgi:thiol-disulfide isomerase/thioredoxin
MLTGRKVEQVKVNAMYANRLLIAAALAGALATSIGTLSAVNGAEVRGVLRPPSSPVRLPVESEFPSLAGANGWLSSQPLTAAALRGKVVLIDFWTYTCINWRRSLPYVRAWSERYKDNGLVVIGVHSPEFEFEKDVGNIRRAVNDMGVAHPVAVDTNHAVWRAFMNQYWPARYFIDAQGRVRHHQFGEGEYEQGEAVIRQLLADAGNGVGDRLASVEPRPAEIAADWRQLKSPETYVRYDHISNFASPGGAAVDKRRVYSVPPRLNLNHWALSGDWTMRRQSTALNQANGRIVHRFHARDLHLVMGPATPRTAVRFRVLIDGKPPGAAHGIDVDEQGNGTVAEQRLYFLIRQPEPITDRLFEIEFLDPGAEAFAFTFG